jgi:ABC-type sugar transport system ATPase subunit
LACGVGQAYFVDVKQLDGFGVRVQNLHKSYANDAGRTVVSALDGISLAVNPGEIFTILGPSGCGKSTLLRALAGLEEPEHGTISLGNRTVMDVTTGTNVPARERQIGMVFQDYALYPHMDVERNIMFGLKTRKVPSGEIQERTDTALRMVEMESFRNRKPSQLSGGQRQRVALARAVAANPRLLLFDEPLSNLDPILRSMLRSELRMLIERIGTTAIYVTHDQEEAMILGDRLAVMNNGKIEQIDTPEQVYRLPQTIFVARFTGRPTTNLIEGVVDRHEERWNLVPIESRARTLSLPEELSEFRGQRVMLHIRPEDLTVASKSDESVAAELKVMAVLPEGSHTYVQCELGGPYEPLLIRDTTNALDRAAVGNRVPVRISRMTVYSIESGYLLKEIEVGSHA